MEPQSRDTPIEDRLAHEDWLRRFVVHAYKQVAEAIADLDEPYRTAVLLRFFEGLPPREIARRVGLSGSATRL